MKTTQQNFPVGCLIQQKFKPIVLKYYEAARIADDVADNPNSDKEQKLANLEQIEKDFHAKKDNTPAGDLAQEFIKWNLASGLYTDLIEAFRMDIKNQKIEIWEQLLNYCQYSAAPVGRFLLAIHDENPATYIPGETLCIVLQIIDHIQDLKFDACEIKRCYLPQDILDKYGVYQSDLCLTYTTPQLKLLLQEMTTRLRQMLRDSRVLLSLIRNRRLKAEVGVIFSLTNSMLNLIDNSDVIASPPKLKKISWIKAFVYGIAVGLFTRTKSCNVLR